MVIVRYQHIVLHESSIIVSKGNRDEYSLLLSRRERWVVALCADISDLLQCPGSQNTMSDENTPYQIGFTSINRLASGLLHFRYVGAFPFSYHSITIAGRPPTW